MKLKFKLSLMVIAVIAIIVTAIAVLLLREASKISIEMAEESKSNYLESRVNYWKGREDAHIRALETLAGVMEDYEDIPVAERRDQFDRILRGATIENESWILTYSIWKPNALDGMDSQFIGRTGSSPDGQYAMVVTKETGSITARASTDIPDTMARLNGPNAHKDRFDDPIPRTINGKDTFVIIITVPIINPRTDEVVGRVGCLLDISVIQPTIEETLRTREEVALIVMYSSNGSILGHFIPERIGKNMLDVDVEYGDARQEAFEAIQKGTGFIGGTYDPTLRTNVKLMMQSFPIGNSDQTWSILVGSSEAYMLRHVNAITRFTIIVAVIALFIAAIIAYFVLNSVTKPIVNVTETLKDIAQGEGDLTHSIILNSKDEVGDLANYFNQTLEKIKNLVLSIKKEAANLSDIGKHFFNSRRRLRNAGCLAFYLVI